MQVQLKKGGGCSEQVAKPVVTDNDLQRFEEDYTIQRCRFGFESISKCKSKSMNYFKSKIQSNPRTHLNPNPDSNPLKIHLNF